MEAALSMKKVAWDEAGGKVQVIQGLVSHIRNFGIYPKRYWRILSRKMTYQFRLFKVILTVICAVLSCLSCLRLFAIPRTVAHQVPLSMGILQVRILEWVAILPPDSGLPGSSVVKNLPLMQEMQKTQVWSLGSERFPGRRKWHPTPEFLPGKSHGQRSLAGYSPRGCKRAGCDSSTKQQIADSHCCTAETNTTL